MKTVFLSTWLLCLSLVSTTSFAANDYTPTQENKAARKEFQDNKFGVFIHWGIYSMLADGEWNMTNKNLDHKEYAKLASGFYPSKFDARSWVKDIKAAGAKYICFTTRHHDGFSMFDTKQCDYNIVKATPYQRDVLKELAEACEAEGIKLHLYYSHLDWTRNDYPWGRTGRGTGRSNPEGNWPTYYQFMNNQLTELLTNYGPIGAVWFDGWWDQDQNPDFDWQLPYQYDLIHKLQPSCLIGNNHHQSPFAGEDIQMFERDLPGENHSGLSGQEISKLPLETCETMNRTWGYRITDQNYKSTKELLHLLIKAAGNNANLLMNVGPQPNGELPEAAVQRFKEMGDWMSANGETIYGTRGGLIEPHSWGVTTQKDNKLYVHVLDYNDKAIYLPMEAKQVKKVVLYKDKTPLRINRDKTGILIELPEQMDDIDTIIEITLG